MVAISIGVMSLQYIFCFTYINCVFRYNDRQLIIIIYYIIIYYCYNPHNVVLHDAHDHCSSYYKQIKRQPETYIYILITGTCLALITVRFSSPIRSRHLHGVVIVLFTTTYPKINMMNTLYIS